MSAETQTTQLAVRAGLGAVLALIIAGTALAQEGKIADLPPEIAALAEKAKSEGEVVVYSASSDDINADLKKGFEATFGVTMNYLRLTSGPQAAKVRQELDANAVQVDVFNTGDPSFAREMVEKNLVQPIGDVPVPEGFPADPNVTSHCVQAQQFAHSIGYNTRGLGENEAPAEWTDLLDPKWKGKIGMVSPRVGTGIQTWWFMIRDEMGEDFLDKLAGQEVRLYEDVGSIHNDLASGAITIQVPGWPYGIQSLADRGAPVQSVYPSPTSGVSDTQCVMTAAPHPNAAKLYIWYTMTMEGQVAINGNHRGNSPMEGVKGSDPLPPETVFPEPADIVAAREELFSLADRVAAGGQ